MDAVALAMVEALPTTAPVVGWQTLGPVFSGSSQTWQDFAISTDGTRMYLSHGYTTGTLNALRILKTDGTGVAGTSAPSPLRGVGGAWCNGKHYALGGAQGADGSAPVASVSTYTPAGTDGASGVWSAASPFPASIALSYVAAASLGNYVYGAGGRTGAGVGTGSSYFFRFDTVAGTWSSLAALPDARSSGSLVAYGTKLFHFGGLDTSGGQTATVFIFDTVTGTWTTATNSLSGGIAAAPFFVVGSAAYSLNRAYDLAALNVPATPSPWQASAPPTSHGTYPGGVAIGASLYLVSGSGTANVDKLDLGAGTGYTTAVLGVKSLLNPLLAGVASVLPKTPPTVTADRTAYAQNVQTLKALAAL